MKTMKVKTNIMCGACVAKVTPVLDEKIGKTMWTVDILNPAKILSVTNEKLTEEEIIRSVEQAGYKAEKLS